MTSSRLDKGLLAIPKSLAVGWFPISDEQINIYFGLSLVIQKKNYISWMGSSREARIIGMSEWFNISKLKSGEEIVIQLIDREALVYRIMTEDEYISRHKSFESKFDKSIDISESNNNLAEIANLNNFDLYNTALRELNRLSKVELTARMYSKIRETQVRENIPASLRIILENIYKGHCQLCKFGFLKRDMKPYYEVHHIRPEFGSHPKNILVVCPNCHAQFTYAKINQYFSNKWLTKVRFNEREFKVYQAISDELLIYNYKTIYI